MYPWKKLANFGINHVLDNGDLSCMTNGRNAWYVDADSGLDASGDGRSWDHPFLTITEALEKAQDYDVIFLAQATMKLTTGETFPLVVTQEGLRIIGSNVSMNQNKSLIYNASTDDNVFQIKANNVEIRNLSITQGAAKDIICLGDATFSGLGIYKFYLGTCRIDGYSAGKTAVASYAADVDAPDIHIENCVIRGCTDHAIEANWTRAMISDNVIYTVAAKAGINHIPNAGDRGGSIYANNRIIGVNSTDTGILLTGTPTAGLLSAYGNYIFNCNTTITQSANNVCVQMNYENDGAGGALIDPIA
jgi:hypothetical protein